MISKNKLCYDATNDKGDKVGAHLIASGGELTSTTLGGSEALDVNIVGAAGSGVYNEDDAYVDGGAGQSILMRRQDTLATDTSADDDWQFFKSTASGELYVHDQEANASLNGIEAITDQMTFDGGNLNVAADIDIKSSVADDEVDTENPLKMGSHSSFGVLSAISADGDKADLISDKYRRLMTSNSYRVALKNSNETVGLTAAELVSTPSAGRQEVEIYNNSDDEIYLGFDASVTSANGFPIAACSSYTVKLSEDLDIFAIGAAAGQDVRIMEIG